MRKAIFLAAALTASTFATTRAEAASWLIAGSGCVVDPEDIAAGNYEYLTAAVRFRPGFTGDIRLRCPVTVGEGVVQGSGYLLDLYSIDGGTHSRVTVDLVKMPLATGATTHVESNPAPNVGCNFVASDDDLNENAYGIDTDPCIHSFDPNTFLYLAVVTITRTVTTEDPRFYGLSIFGGP